MFANGAYARLWEVKRVAEKYSDVRISTSKKQDDGSYKDDFSGFVRMIGKAHKALDYIHEQESFRILSCGVESRYDKETGAGDPGDQGRIRPPGRRNDHVEIVRRGLCTNR